LYEAKTLSNIMKQIGEMAGKPTVCVITSMDEPLGRFVGNNLEIKESIDFLKGKGQRDVPGRSDGPSGPRYGK
jgi:pyrimidine-nucleoside phosphorylase